jgi:hypothetical protein
MKIPDEVIEMHYLKDALDRLVDTILDREGELGRDMLQTFADELQEKIKRKKN